MSETLLDGSPSAIIVLDPDANREGFRICDCTQTPLDTRTNLDVTVVFEWDTQEMTVFAGTNRAETLPLEVVATRMRTGVRDSEPSLHIFRKTIQVLEVGMIDNTVHQTFNEGVNGCRAQ